MSGSGAEQDISSKTALIGRSAPKAADPQPRPVYRKQTIVQVASLQKLRRPVGEASQFGRRPAIGGK